jgi:hypothetical protein
MKYLLTLFLIVLFYSSVLAQASAVVFSEAGEKFTVILNGEKKNEKPLTNVKIQGLTAEFYQARIDFEDPLLKDFAEGNFAVQRGSEVTYIVKKNKKGEYVLRFYGQTEATGTASSGDSSSEVKSFAEVDDSEHQTEEIRVNQTMSIQEEPVSKTTVTQTTTTTTKAQPAAPVEGGSVSMGINVDGVNMGISINATESGASMDMNVQETQQTTVTTTTTTTTTAAPQQTAPQPAPRPAASAPAPAPAQPVGRCASSMSASSFAKAKDNISSNSFEDSKMTVAKQVTKANCMTAAQIAEVMALFSFEDSKLQFAKFAYDFCYNQGDYYEVNQAFTFESSIEDLNEYLESK